MPPRTVRWDQIKSLEGQLLGTTEWQEVTQERINLFAQATGDKQWIHTDPERAKRESPFRRKTVAHGYFTLSLVPAALWELIEVTGPGMGMMINQSAEKVEWMAPVPIPSSVRVRLVIAHVEEFESGFAIAIQATVEVQGRSKPAMVAELHYRYFSRA